MGGMSESQDSKHRSRESSQLQPRVLEKGLRKGWELKDRGQVLTELP